VSPRDDGYHGERRGDFGPMSILLNVLWIVIAGGMVTCGQYLVAGLGLCVTIVGIPFGIQCFKLGIVSLIPFGRDVSATGDLSRGPLGALLNIVWLVFGGIWIFLTHLFFAMLCAITIIGIPFAVQHWKLAKLALWPFGREIS
jgi:uncharacterized membrane protein YccF (DUF307 family)